MVNFMLCKFPFNFFFLKTVVGHGIPGRVRVAQGACVGRSSAPSSVAKPIWVDCHPDTEVHSLPHGSDMGATSVATEAGNPTPWEASNAPGAEFPFSCSLSHQPARRYGTSPPTHSQQGDKGRPGSEAADRGGPPCRVTDQQHQHLGSC